MAKEKDLQQARKVYETLCSTLTGHDWHFERDDDKLEIECGARGEDLPIKLTIRVDAERRLVLLLSRLPLVIPEDNRVDLAIAVSIVNNKLVDGSFDYDIKSGHMFFRMTNSFFESELGEEAFTYMLFCSCQTINVYNGKFLMMAKNMMTLEQFALND